MTQDEIETATATIEELEDFLKDDMCVTEGCINLTYGGIIYCAPCYHGSATRGSTIQIAAKQRLEQLKRSK